MKKEYIILGLIIVALSAYLVMHKKDRNNYIIPSVPEINVADITEITLEKDGKNTLLTKKDGAWFVTDKNYPASQESVTAMLDIVKSLKLSALVSESGNLAPYELDARNRIDVTVKSKTETLRKFEIGKIAPSFRHTFVRLDGNSNVYHAAKSFRRDFDKTVDDLRDKSVLSFDKNKIASITFKKGDHKRDVLIKDGKPVNSKDDKADSSKEPKEVKSDDNKAVPGDSSSDKTENKRLDNSAAATPVENSASIEALLGTLSSFKCHSFTGTDSKDEFKGMEEIGSIILKGDKELSFVIYKKDAKDNYPAISSENSYPFMIDTYQGDDIISRLDDILGLKKDDNKDKSLNNSNMDLSGTTAPESETADLIKDRETQPPAIEESPTTPEVKN